jgi:hypothetical protein
VWAPLPVWAIWETRKSWPTMGSRTAPRRLRDRTRRENGALPARVCVYLGRWLLPFDLVLQPQQAHGLQGPFVDKLKAFGCGRNYFVNLVLGIVHIVHTLREGR